MCTALYVETSRGVFNSQIEQRFIYLPGKHTSIKLRRENSACVNQLKMTTLVPLVAFVLNAICKTRLSSYTMNMKSKGYVI